MKLAVDIGNTSITCGIFKNQNIIKNLHFKTIEELIAETNVSQFKKIIISSVVPQLTKDIQKQINEIFTGDLIFINHQNYSLKLNVPNPQSIGNDRLCNIFATVSIYKTPSIIIDFGTATTYDVINKNNEFIGGAIGSGVETSANYLINKAALLSKTDLQFPKNAIGINTKENIQSGIMFGAIDQVEGMVKRIQNERADNYQVIITGGLSKRLSPNLSIEHTLDMDLTLKGIIYIDEANS
jgi:type III pantothenate kinase